MMRRDEKNKLTTPGGYLGDVLMNSRHRFLATRRLALAQWTALKRRSLGAGTIAFLNSCIGNKFIPSETRGLGGERVFRRPGQISRHNSYKSVTELFMSFNFNQLVSHVQFLLSQIHNMQNVSSGHTKIDSTTLSWNVIGGFTGSAEVSLVQLLSDVRQHPEAIHWPHAMSATGAMHWRQAWPRSLGTQSQAKRLTQPAHWRQTIPMVQTMVLHDALPRWMHAPGAMFQIPLSPGAPAVPWPAGQLPQVVLRNKTTTMGPAMHQASPSPASLPSQSIVPWHSMLLRQSLHLRQPLQPLTQLSFKVPARAMRATTPDETSMRAVDRLLTLTKVQNWTKAVELHAAAFQTIVSNIPGQTIFDTTHVRHLGRESLQPRVGLNPDSLRLVTKVTREHWLRNLTSQIPAKDTAIAFAEPGRASEVRSLPENPINSLRLTQANTKPRSLDPAFEFIPRSLLTTLTRRHASLVESPHFETKLLETKSLETKLLKPTALAPITSPVTRNVQSALELVLVRKEGASRAPSVDFVFAQPTRQKTSEEHVVQRIEQRAIVELVRKEVKQSMDRVSPLQDLSRDDYADISEHVYSILMKRLTIERERRG